MCPLNNIRGQHIWQIQQLFKQCFSTKIAGFWPSAPSGRLTTRMLFRLCLFSASSILCTRELTSDFSSAICTVCVPCWSSTMPICSSASVILPLILSKSWRIRVHSDAGWSMRTIIRDLKPSIADRIGLVVASGAVSSAVEGRAVSCASEEDDMPEGDAEVPGPCTVPSFVHRKWRLTLLLVSLCLALSLGAVAFGPCWAYPTVSRHDRRHRGSWMPTGAAVSLVDS